MAYALQPDGALETAERPLAVALEDRHSRGATIVDWQRQTGRPDRARILLRYDQARFEGLVRAALCSGSCAASLPRRSEEHTSELQSLMRISYAVFCL